jgi:hypothetical protein
MVNSAVASQQKPRTRRKMLALAPELIDRPSRTGENQCAMAAWAGLGGWPSNMWELGCQGPGEAC